MRVAVLTAALALAGGPALAAPPPLAVGVVPIGGDADGASRAEATQILERALGGLDGIEVVSFAGMDAVLGAGASDRLAECGSDDACLRAAVARVRTDRIVAGSLDVERNLRLRLVDTATAGPPRVRVVRAVGFTQAGLLQGVTAAALDLFPERADAAFGTIFVEGGRPGAAVLVDGVAAGELSMEAPPRAAVRVPAGTRTVRVVAPGHAPFDAEVEVLLGQTARLEVELSKNRSPVPLYLAGAGVAAAGIATGLALAVKSRADAWEDACPPRMPCAAGYTRARYDSDDRFVTGGRWAANGLFAVAGAALVGAVVWFIADPGEDEVTP